MNKLSGYLCCDNSPSPGGECSLHDAAGKVLATGRIYSVHKIRPGQRGDWISDSYVYVRVRSGGTSYWGRSYGNGLSCNVRQYAS